MVKTAVLVSGGGTNLQALIDASARGEMPDVELALVCLLYTSPSPRDLG